MAESERHQRTEEPTPRRRREARERGQVSSSSDFVAAAGLAAGAGALALGGPVLASTMADQLASAAGSLSELGTGALDVPASTEILTESSRAHLSALALLVLPLLLVTAFAGYAQVGVRVAPKALEMDPARLSPLRGLQRIFSLRGAARTGFSLAKVLGLTAVAGWVAWLHVDEVIRAGSNDLGPLLAAAGVLVVRVAGALVAVLLVLGGADVLLQRYQGERDLRMTRTEVKDEQRREEGDPHVRARRRARGRELAMGRMLNDVPKATVVITNPSHYAVALRYERDAGERQAPVVVAKGADLLAQRIKELAAASGVPRHEDVALARALYRRVAVGQEIPEELYAAVAAVLAHVYRLRSAEAV